jgi:hypothetical protein
MTRASSAGLTKGLASTFVAAAFAAGCGSSAPIDQNYGTNLGADFVAPVVDAGSEAGGGGTGGASGSGGSGGGADAAAGTGGTAGMAGTGGASGAGGTAGGAGAGGAAGGA